MATESIRERILQHGATSLGVINGAGSYHIAVTTVGRSQVEPSNLDQLPALHLTEGEEVVEEGPNPVVTRTLLLTVRGWIAVSAEFPDMSLATLQNRLMADVERALLTDPTRGGLATNTTLIGSVIHDDDERGVTGSLSVTFLVLYQTLRTDPATLG